MSFLIDENLSFRLKRLLKPAFPDCRHVSDDGLQSAADDAILARAVRDGLTILSKDDDFRERLERLGPPPKLVFVRLGNVATDAVASAILRRRTELEAFLNEPSAGVLVLEPTIDDRR